jgi:hypothetical protein
MEMTMISNKYKTKLHMIGMAMTMLLFTSILAQPQPQLATAQDTQNVSLIVDSSCQTKMADAMHSKDSTIDKTKAILMAEENSEFTAKTSIYNSTFSGIFNTWSLDTVNCSVTWRDTNIAYSLSDEKGYVKNIVVTLDPSLTEVMNISEHVGGQYGYSFNNINWAGYEFVGSSFTSTTNPTVTTYEGKTTFALPAVSQPWSGACNSKPCNLAIWTGLEETKGASNTDIVQAGVDRKITCTPTCITNTFFWYQFDTTSNAFQCGGITINTGDSISITVTNQAKTGGPNNKYNVSMQDLTSGGGCSLTGQIYNDMTAPKYAPFINERAKYPGYDYSTLAQFTSDTMTGTVYYSSASHSIQDPYNNGWWREDIMKNLGTTNINPGTVSSGAFTQPWSSSAGT